MSSGFGVDLLLVLLVVAVFWTVIETVVRVERDAAREWLRRDAVDLDGADYLRQGGTERRKP